MLSVATGQLDLAHQRLLNIRRRCLERGEEFELIFAAFYGGMTEIWRGNFTDAALVAEDATERAEQLGGDLPRSMALMIRAALSAYAGRIDDARDDAHAALAASRRSGATNLAAWPITTLGFVDVSLGNYRAALTTLEPHLHALHAAPNGTEIFAAAFAPDAAEALIALGRLDDAERLVALLERNGRRLDRAWTLAVGARCRAMLLAAQCDLAAASDAAQQAMVEHARLPMPFERARTQLLLGQLQRRQRNTEGAAATQREALRAFEDLDTPLWADRARAELARSNVGPRRTTILTPSERRVAELVASGMTNRDVAGALFISPKTVEANLARIYRKLDIHSRAELGWRMGQSAG